MEDGSSIGNFLAVAAQPLISSAPDAANTPLILDLLILLILILINAFFSATEIAVITVNDNKVRKRRRRAIRSPRSWSG